MREFVQGASLSPDGMKRPKLFYGWKVAFVAFLANFMAVGTGFYAINAFLEPLCAQKGWSRTSINIAPMLGTLFGFGSQLFYGTIVGKVGPRLLMVAGSLVAGIAFVLLGQISSLSWFYLLYVMLYMGNGAYAGIVANTAVNNWFVLKRGKALGFATSGMSLSGVVFPFLLLLILVRWNLSLAFLTGGLLVLLMAPLSWKIIRNWPEDMGTWPDGIERPSNAIARSEEGVNVSALAKDRVEPMPLFSSGTFWKLGIGYALMMTGAVGVMSQLKPRFVELGFGDITAMAFMSFGALMGAIGKYFWGFLCDRKRPDLVVTALALMNALGLAAGILAKGILGILIFVTVFGVSMGGIQSTFPIIVAYVYGRENFPYVIRFLYFVLILELSGYLLAGQSFDRFGSYTPAYIVFLIMDIISSFLLFRLNITNS